MGLFGLAIGGVVWVNANSQSVRFFNIISVVLFSTSMVFAETALRFSQTGAGWSPLGRMSYDESLGWTRSTLSDFEALDRGEHTDYPSEGYPVGFDTTTKQRVVCLGSSATGGAFQNDDIGEFYPARLSEVLGDQVDVINQGVGGWTSFHMAHYFESKAAELSPDIVTVYAGHNDLLTKSAAPYRDLYSAWRSDAVPSGPSVLDSVLLYQGLRFVVGAIVSPEGAVAVPLEHARENLVRIINAAEAQGAEVILMTEAISPDSGPMAAYSNMMIEIAESYESTSYIEIPAVVLGRGSSMFLDDVHLTDAGHRTVAGEIANHIRGSLDNLR
jgi:lysophospholipase L1-like esterase